MPNPQLFDLIPNPQLFDLIHYIDPQILSKIEESALELKIFG
jgi:hypothetical protein